MQINAVIFLQATRPIWESAIWVRNGHIFIARAWYWNSFSFSAYGRFSCVRNVTCTLGSDIIWRHSCVLEQSVSLLRRISATEMIILSSWMIGWAHSLWECIVKGFVSSAAPLLKQTNKEKNHSSNANKVQICMRYGIWTSIWNRNHASIVYIKCNTSNPDPLVSLQNGRRRW